MLSSLVVRAVQLAPPTPGGTLTAWRADPLAAAVIVLAAGGYLYAMVRLRGQGRRWPVRRGLAFVGLGLGAMALTSMGWPAVYAPALFSVYAAHVMALLLVVPFLLALGRPIELASAALSARGSARLAAVLSSRPMRLFTVPVVSPLLLAVVPFLVFFTPLLPFSLAHPVALSALRLVLLLLGVAVLVPLWEADNTGLRIPYAAALMFAFVELLADAVPGIVVRLDTHVLAAGYFIHLARPWGPTPLHDQQLGGDLLWGLGEAIDLPFLAMLVLLWVRSDAREAARVDAALDAARTPPTDRPSLGRGAAAAESDDEAPWWERDASVFGDRAGQYQRRPEP